MSETDSESGMDWRERAEQLQERGGIPEQRAKIVALREAGYSYQGIVDTLDLSSRGSVLNQVEAYRETISEDTWHAEHYADV